jgi:mono/diheme cytochrome c family protein
MKNQKKVNFLFLVTLMIGVSFLMFSVSSVAQNAWTAPAKYKTMKNAKAGAKDAENIGKNLFSQHCKTCHGVKGAGDGAKASGLDTKIRDFSLAAFQAQTDGEIYYKSFVGKDEMPNFEKKITSEGDRWLLVNYIRTLKKK